MTELLTMPIPFASSLVVLAMVAAFFFIKFLVLALSLDQEEARSSGKLSGQFANPRQQVSRIGIKPITVRTTRRLDAQR